MVSDKKVVIALGGNAIEVNNEAMADAQQQAIAHTAQQLVRIISEGYKIAITHGNGPQVGNILLQQRAADSKKTPAMPIDVCGAMSQGMIGYWMINALDNALAKAGIDKQTVNVITRSLVSPNDDAFAHPVKPIGPFYTKEEAAKKMQQDQFLFKEDAGRGYRRVIASPYPKQIIESCAICDLVNAGYIVVAVGGGGIPIIKKSDGYHGAEAVIDKDFGAKQLADGIDADILLLLTAVDNVYLDYRMPQQERLGRVSVDQLRHYIAENQFAPGSMLPKIKAAISFVSGRSGRKAVITSLDHAQSALHEGGAMGTTITD